MNLVLWRELGFYGAKSDVFYETVIKDEAGWADGPGSLLILHT